MAIAVFLLSRLAVDTPAWQTSLFMLILGLGIGMVMQVLVLAAQNAVPYELLGVATSGSTLFRQVGGSIGVAIFGAIFANRLAANLAERLPANAKIPAAADPAAVGRLPPEVHLPYVTAFAESLRPVFLVGACIAVLAFLLSWLLREVPLRKSVRPAGATESFAMPRDATSLHEMERIIAALTQRENRWRVYDLLAERAGVDLEPEELWQLARLGEGREVEPGDGLRRRGLVDGRALSPAGRELVDRVQAARRDGLAELLDGWKPEEHAELRELLDRLSRELVAEPPR
jgi:MFS family permease